MADKTINDIANVITDPAAADEIEGQRTGGGASFRTALSNLHLALTKATDAEAEAGVDTDVLMTPALTNLAIAALATVIADHGALSGLADDDHPQYLKDLIDDLTPQLGGALDLNDQIVSGGALKEVSETLKITSHSGGGTFTPLLADGNEQLINLSSNVTIGKPITTGLPGTGDRRIRMVLEFIQLTPGGHTMTFAGAWTEVLGNLPALNRTTTGDVTQVEIEYDSDLADWRIVGDPVFDIHNQGVVDGTPQPVVDFANRTTPSMELAVQIDIGGALTMPAPTNPPGTDEFGRIYFFIQADGTNDITWDAVYDWQTAGAPDFSALTNGKTSVVVSVKAGTRWLTNLVSNDHGAIF